MSRRGFSWLISWLAGLAAPFMCKSEPDTWEIRVDYSPAVDGSEYRPVGTIIPAAAHCVNCGHDGTVWIPHGDATPVEGEILDMLQCPVCHLYTMCSD